MTITSTPVQSQTWGPHVGFFTPSLPKVNSMVAHQFPNQ